MNIPPFVLNAALLALLVTLVYARKLQRMLAEEEEEATEAYAKWRHANHQLDTMAAKVTKLIGERAELQHRNTDLENRNETLHSALSRKLRGTRV